MAVARSKLGGLWRAVISKQLHEVQFVYDSDAANSAELRSFITKNYNDLKTLNPRFPFLIRCFVGAPPTMAALYGKGHYEERPLLGLSETQIETTLHELVKIGEVYPRGWPVEDDLPALVHAAGSTETPY